jgi:creatinine amidohydrolase/Fe(II)-dependent formamide hydrolase-like protein
MMLFHPDLVQMDKWQPELDIPYDYQPRPNAWDFASPKGPWRFSPDFQEHASPALGERIARAIVSHLSGRIEEELSQVS